MSENQLQDFLSFISRKWMFEIVEVLSQDKKRFTELLDEVSGISNKVLSNRLSILIEHGFITKVVFSLVPLNIKYELLSKGKELMSLYTYLQRYTHLLE